MAAKITVRLGEKDNEVKETRESYSGSMWIGDANDVERPEAWVMLEAGAKSFGQSAKIRFGGGKVESYVEIKDMIELERYGYTIHDLVRRKLDECKRLEKVITKTKGEVIQ